MHGYGRAREAIPSTLFSFADSVRCRIASDGFFFAFLTEKGAKSGAEKGKIEKNQKKIEKKSKKGLKNGGYRVN